MAGESSSVSGFDCTRTCVGHDHWILFAVTNLFPSGLPSTAPHVHRLNLNNIGEPKSDGGGRQARWETDRIWSTGGRWRLTKGKGSGEALLESI